MKSKKDETIEEIKKAEDMETMRRWNYIKQQYKEGWWVRVLLIIAYIVAALGISTWRY